MTKHRERAPGISDSHPLIRMPIAYETILRETPRFKLAIMGIDPFPTNPTGIPFCKPTWQEQYSRGSAGLFVLQSVGVDVHDASEEHPTPVELFMSLAGRHGVAFLNASYHFVGAKLDETTRPYFELAKPFNLSVIQKSGYAVLCGGPPLRMYDPKNKIDTMVSCLHPSYNYPKGRKAWLAAWGPNRINKLFDLGL